MTAESVTVNYTEIGNGAYNYMLEDITGNYSEFGNVSDYQGLVHNPESIFEDPNTTIRLVLCFFAFFANILSIAATASIPRKLTPHLKLIISLGISDILVPVSILIHIVNIAYNVPSFPSVRTHRERLISACIHQTVNSLNVTAHLISLLNLFAMAMDHYLAIMQPLRYKTFVRGKRTNMVITILWILAVFGGFSNFFNAFVPDHSDVRGDGSELNFCERTFNGLYEAEYLVIAITFICLFFILFIYFRIYCIVKKLNNVLAKQLTKKKKSMFTTALIIGTFTVCWMPHMVFQLVMLTAVHTDPEGVRKFLVLYLKLNDYIYNLLIVNSICDPIIYAVRLKEVQLGYVRLLSHCFHYYKLKLANMKYRNSAHYSASRKVSTQICLMDAVDKSDDNELTLLKGQEDRNGTCNGSEPIYFTAKL